MELKRGTRVCVRQEVFGEEGTVFRSRSRETRLRVPFTQEVREMQEVVLDDGCRYRILSIRDGEVQATPVKRSGTEPVGK